MLNGDTARRPTFSMEEEQEFKDFAASPGAMDSIFGRIAPQVCFSKWGQAGGLRDWGQGFEQPRATCRAPVPPFHSPPLVATRP